MPRKCAICSDERRNLIDDKLVRNVANSHIGLEYGFTERQVGQHKKNHVTPFVASANALAQQAIVDKVIEFRTEVNYPTLTKILAMQDRLLHELESADETDQRVSIIKEYRGWNIELAKVSGEYTDKKANPHSVDEVSYTARHERLRALRDAEVHAITSKCEHCGPHNLGAPLDEGEYERLLDGLSSRYKVDKEAVRVAVDGAIQQELGQVG